MKPDSLAAYDQVLRERLDGIDAETLLAAAATVTAQPLTLDDLRAWSAAGRTWALHALAHIDLGAATRLADDLWRLEEIKHVTWADTEKLERRDHAYEIMQRGFHLWSSRLGEIAARR